MSIPSSRIVVREMLYYQVDTEGIDPHGQIDHGFRRFLYTSEQPYRRKLVVGEEWVAIELGWIKKASLIHIVNDEGKGLTQVPTAEESKAIASRVLEVGIGGKSLFEILPGETFRGTPVETALFQLRSRSGKAQYTLTVYPA
jgi:hypothetical protein